MLIRNLKWGRNEESALSSDHLDQLVVINDGVRRFLDSNRLFFKCFYCF